VFQENLKTEPFWMVVGCILVNKVRWNPGVYTEVRRRWPTASLLANASQEELERVVSRLGLGKVRARNLRSFSKAWCMKRPKTAGEIMTMPGCGNYAADSWAIFVEGRKDVRPLDRALQKYLGATDG
jgi:methyl-CpG-binding domain protein 4